MESSETCALCGDTENLTRHHLIPQVRCKNKYREIKNDRSNILIVCQTCHSKIHATFSENELRDIYNTRDALLSSDKIMTYVNWKRKHPNFRSNSTKMSNDRRR